MNNLEQMIKFAREKKAADFVSTFKREVAGRVETHLDTMKTTLAKTLFKKQ